MDAIGSTQTAEAMRMMRASVFIVEDEELIRMMLVEMLEELGHSVVAEAGNIHEGRSLAEIEGYDLAILDINLHGCNVQPIAEVVAQRGLPLIFLSGYGSAGVPDAFKGRPVLNKPCTLDQLKRTIDDVMSHGTTLKHRTTVAKHSKPP